MKNLSLFSAILLFSLNGTYAQGTDLASRHQIDSDVPLEVLSSIDEGNPGLNFSQPLEADQASVVKEEGKANYFHLPALKKEFQVYYRGDSYRKQETYNADGVLLYSREEKMNKVLPRPVYRYMGKKYNGWELKSNVLITIMEGNKKEPVHLTYYKLQLQKGNKKKRILLDGQGNVYTRRRS